MNVFISRDKIVFVTHLQIRFHPADQHVPSDEILFAAHLQIRITLQTNIFIASDECILCWGRTLLALETNAFCGGNKRFSAGGKHVENTRLSVS